MPHRILRMRVYEALSLLTPYNINVEKIRVGPIRDGAYVMANNFFRPSVVFSYGIGSQWGFDTEMARLGHEVHMFDHTIDAPELSSNLMYFHHEGIASQNEGELKTLDFHLQKFAPNLQHGILKMDTEGVELEVFSAISQKTLEKFDQILFEIHNVERIADQQFRRLFKAALLNITRQFTLFHVHGNNYSEVKIVHGFPVCSVLELSFVRTSLVTRSASTTLYPTPLDRPNLDGHPDHLLWYYPFLPTTVSLEDFGAHAYRNYAMASLAGIPDEMVEDL